MFAFDCAKDYLLIGTKVSSGFLMCERAHKTSQQVYEIDDH